MKIKIILRLCLTLGFSTFLILVSGCSAKQVISKPNKSVSIQKSVYSNIEKNLDYSAEVKAWDEVVISSKMPGRIKVKNVDIGDVVNEGDVLFSLENDEYMTQVNAAEASYKVTLENYVNTRDSLIPQQYIQQDSSVKQLKAQVEDMKKTYELGFERYTNCEIDNRTYDDLKLKYDLVKVQYEAAEKNFDLFKKNTSQAMLNIAKSQLAQSEVNISQVKVPFENSNIRAPRAGTIATCNIKQGEMTSSEASAMTLIGDEIYVKINVPDNIVVKLKKDDSVNVWINASPNDSFKGLVNNISPTVDPASRLYGVKIKIDNSKKLIKVGMTATVKFSFDGLKNILSIPSKAIIIEDGISYTFVIKDGVAYKKTITTGITNGDITQVISGLTKNEAVVIEGQTFITNGESVVTN